MKLLNTEYLTATEEIKCDASEDFMKMFYAGELSGLDSIGVIAYHLRKEIIREKDFYVKYKFVDEGSGEVFEMNAGAYADKQMRKAKLYPPELLTAVE